MASLKIEREEFENKIYNLNCIAGMKMIPNNIIDLIITDPPFAIEFKAKRANYNRTEKHVLEGYSEVKQEDYYQFSYDWMKEAYRTLSDSGSMFVFSGWNNLRDILNALHDTKFIQVNHLIWKYQFGVVTKNRFVTSHYHCLYVCKNEKERKFYRNARFEDGSVRYRDMEDVWVMPREYWRGEKKTPTKLPTEVIRKLIQYTSTDNDLVLDPFLGSGQVAVVSKEMNRNFVGFEIVQEYFEFAEQRLKNTKKASFIKWEYDET